MTRTYHQTQGHAELDLIDRGFRWNGSDDDGQWSRNGITAVILFEARGHFIIYRREIV